MKQTSHCFVRDLFAKYYKLHVLLDNARPKETLRGFELYWGKLANKRVDLLTPLDLQEWMNDLAVRKGNQTANRQFSNLRACLNWGQRMRLIKMDPNPCDAIKRKQTTEREEYLTQEQCARLKTVLDKEEQDIQDAIWILLLTAARKSNVLAMQWRDIDLQACVWTVQRQDSKNGKSMRIPLTAASMAILQRRATSFLHKTVWVFPSPDTVLHHRVNIDYKWRQIREEAGVAHLHIHDLRHTMATWMGASGSSTLSIQKMLHHSDPKMSERYTHVWIDTVRTELERAQSAFM